MQIYNYGNIYYKFCAVKKYNQLSTNFFILWYEKKKENMLFLAFETQKVMSDLKDSCGYFSSLHSDFHFVDKSNFFQHSKT